MPVNNAHISTEHSTHTVKDYIKNYTQIADTVAVLAQNNFITESLFTQGYSADGGGIQYGVAKAVGYHFTNEGMDPNEDFSINEGSEFHRVHMQEALPQTAYVRKYGIEGEITFEEERRNQLGALARLTVRMKNTLVKHLDSVALAMLAGNSSIRDYTAAAAWGPTATTIFDDLVTVQGMLTDEAASGGVYNPDTLVMSYNTYSKLRRNRDMRDFFGSQAPSGYQNARPQFIGSLEELDGMTIMRSRWMRDDMVFALERGAIGGVADEVPLYFQPPERIMKREVIEIRGGRTTVAFLSDPGAIVRIKGI